MCAKCSLKEANKLYNKRHAVDEGRVIKTRRRRVQDRMPGDTPILNWDEFLSMLRENKECAFELYAKVKLTVEESSNDNEELDAPKVAWIIAHAVREQTGYRFKSVHLNHNAKPTTHITEVTKRNNRARYLMTSKSIRTTALSSRENSQSHDYTKMKRNGARG